jgi:hypothetical protein
MASDDDESEDEGGTLIKLAIEEWDEVDRDEKKQNSPMAEQPKAKKEPSSHELFGVPALACPMCGARDCMVYPDSTGAKLVRCLNCFKYELFKAK